MSWTPEKIASLMSSRNDVASAGASDRVAQLRLVLDGIQQDGESGHSLADLVEKLADGARDASWRLPLGDSGLLDFVLSAVPVKGPQHPLNKQALRLIGNACADCDENRARVIASGALRSFIMAILADSAEDAFLPFAIAAALNVCVDYKPAQELASEAGLSRVLVDIVSGPRLRSCQAFLGHILTILELLCSQDVEPKAANPNTPSILLALATSERYDADLESFLEVCTPALAYLTYQELQPHVLQDEGMERLQHAFHQLYTRFDVADLDPDTAKQLKQVGDAFLSAFADISALPDFSTACPLDSKPVQTLIDWLATPPSLSHLQTAACLALGNLSRSDEASTALLSRVQKPLIDTLWRAVPPTPSQPPAAQAATPPLQLIHAALSFLKNLAIPQVNKPPLGATLLDPESPLLPRLWTSTRTQPQLQFAAVSLTRLLLAACPANVRHLCAPSPGSENSDANHPSNLALLASTAASADEEPIHLEAARAASQVCRAVHSSPASETLDPSWTWSAAGPSAPDHNPDQDQDHHVHGSASDDALLTRFYASHGTAIARGLARLLTQPRFPSLRSEAVFVLALMSRSAAGARMALRVLPPPPVASASTTSTGTTAVPSTAAAAAWQVLARVILTPSTSTSTSTATSTATSHSTSDSDSEPELSSITAELAAAFNPSALPAASGETRDEQDQAGERTQDAEDAAVTLKKLSLQPQLDVQAQREQPARAASMDRENAMVLVAELLRRYPDELSGLRRPLERVLSRGGELVAQGRQN